MATPLTPTELAYLRGSNHRVKLYLSVHKPRILLTALVNDGSITRGETLILYDNGTGTGFSSIKAGHILRVETATGPELVRVRSITGDQTSGTVTVAANSTLWADNQSIEILEDDPLSSLIPRFDSGGTFYKDYDITYTDQNLKPPPVCIAGPHRALFLEPGGAWSGQISQSSDDAAETSGIVSLILANLSATINTFWWGLRFQNVAIPAGAIITAATVTVNVVSTANDSPNFNIYAQAADNATTFTTGASNISSRSRTTAFTAWVDTNIGAGTKTSPDLSAVIQEVIDRPGWTSGNSLALIWDALSGVSFSITAWDGNPALAATLSITYTVPTTLTFDLTDSYAIAKNATIDAGEYALSITPDDGVTITETSPGVFEVEFEDPGQYWAEASCTDSNDKSQLTYRRIFVHDPNPESADYPYTDLAIESLQGDYNRGGWGLSIEVRAAVGDTVSAEDFPGETLVVIWYESWYGEDELYIGGPEHAQNILFAGYIKRDSTEANWNESSVSFEAATLEQWLREVLMRSISLEAKAGTPSRWVEYALWLTPGRAIHHILRWHSWFFEMADLYGLADSEVGRKYAEIQRSNLLAMAQEMARSRAASLCANKAGQLFFKPNWQLLPVSERDGATELAELIAGSDLSNISINEQPPQVAWVMVTGLAFTGGALAAYCAQAPGEVPVRRGAGEIQIDGQVLSDQTGANELAGRYLAAANNPTPELSGQMVGLWLGALDVPEPVFWQISLDGSETARGIVWEDKRLILRTVRASYDSRAGMITTQVTFEPEALGPVGVTMACLSDLPAAPSGGQPRWETGDDGSTDIGGLQALYVGEDEGSGVFYRDDNDTAWAEMIDTPALCLEIDPWWMTRFRNNTYNPLGAILWQGGTGVMYRSPDGGVTWLELVPATDPPNAWGDSPAPTVAELEFVCIRASMFVLDHFYALARWANGSGDYRGWIVWTADNGVSWTWVALDDTDEVYPIWLSLSLGAGGNLWATYLRGGHLYLSKAHPLSPETFTETDLGVATIADVLSRAKWAFPVSAYGDDNLVFVGGRMDSPAGLSGVKQVIRSTNAASSFTVIEDGWSGDHCAALLVGPDTGSGRNYYAVRQSGD